MAAVRGVAAPRPGPVTVLDPTAPEYRDAAAQVLAELGADAQDPAVRQVVRVDLDGDGTDEVLVRAEVADRASLRPVAGDYSVVFVRRLVGGTVQNTVVAADVPAIDPARSGRLRSTTWPPSPTSTATAAWRSSSSGATTRAAGSSGTSCRAIGWPRCSRPGAVRDVEVRVDAVRSFEDFYRAEWAGLRRAVGFTVGDGDVARDCVDEAMTRAYERWDQVAAMDRPAGWVYRVAVNLARNRARHRRVERDRQPAAGPATAPGADDVADPALAAALARLPDGPAVGRRAAVLPRLVRRGRRRRARRRAGHRQEPPAPGAAPSRVQLGESGIMSDAADVEQRLRAHFADGPPASRSASPTPGPRWPPPGPARRAPGAGGRSPAGAAARSAWRWSAAWPPPASSPWSRWW